MLLTERRRGGLRRLLGRGGVLLSMTGLRPLWDWSAVKYLLHELIVPKTQTRRTGLILPEHEHSPSLTRMKLSIRGQR